MGACKNEATKKAFEKEFKQVPDIARLARTTVPPITVKEAVAAARRVETAHKDLSKDKAEQVEKEEPYKEVRQQSHPHANKKLHTTNMLHAHAHKKVHTTNI